MLAVVTLILKALGKFNEGDFRANSGYLYVSIIYNASICLALYCLAVFWICVNDDLKLFRSVLLISFSAHPDVNQSSSKVSLRQGHFVLLILAICCNINSCRSQRHYEAWPIH